MSLDARITRELEAAGIRRGAPLVVVDADEVLVHFAEDFGAYCASQGYRFALTEYSLDSALRDAAGRVLGRDEVNPLIHGFIDAHTHRQRPVDGAAAALAALAEVAQVVVLTNAPPHVRDQRVRNLAALGMDYPVIVNQGGKGRALAWLRRQADAQTAFVDDSHAQIGSAAKHAPAVTRLHLVGSAMVRAVVGPADDAHHHPADWTECETMIRAALAL